jgi:uncharacterized membrane protein YkvA (DUF1232 family)
LLPAASRAPIYARLVWALVRDERVPLARKAILAAAAGYLVVGRDIVPDELPVLGGVDDLVVVALAIDLFLDGVDDALVDERLAVLGLERADYERDLAGIRRLLPGPVRRLVRRLPELARFGARALQSSGIGPRLRGWINEEGSIA